MQQWEQHLCTSARELRLHILTETHAIEVDHARNYRAAIKQALQYAAETKKTPGVALIMDGVRDTLQAVQAGKKLAEEAGVTFWLINEYVSVNDLADQKPKSASTAQQTAPPPQVQEKTARVQNVEKQYWLNSKSGVRHNRSCRWFGNTTNGRPCGPDEGRACKQCGG